MKRGCIFLAAAAVFLTGCQNGQDFSNLLNKDAPVTIHVWHYYNGIQQSQFDELVNEFNDTVGSEQGIVVDASTKNSVNELADSVLSAVKKEPGADEAPDVFATYMETAYKLDQMGQLADMSRYFTEEEQKQYVDEYMQEGAFSGEGTLKIFPTAKSTEILMVNATDWEKFAEKEDVAYEDLATWEGLVEVSEKYYNYTDGLTPEIPNDGKSFFGRDSLANYLFVGAKQLGHAFAEADQDGAVTVQADKETVRRLWDHYYVPYVKGYFGAESRFRSDDAKIGTIIALVCSTTGAVYYPTEVTIDDEYTYPIENVVLPVPNFAGCDPYAVQQGAGMSVIKSDEKREYACAVFLKWFTENSQNIQFAVNSGYLPVKKDANDLQAILKESGEENLSDTMRDTFQVAIDEVENYTLYTSPPYENSAEARDYIGNMVETTAQEAKDAAWKRIRAGEDRIAVLEEYTNDQAFDAWFTDFKAGFDALGDYSGK